MSFLMNYMEFISSGATSSALLVPLTIQSREPGCTNSRKKHNPRTVKKVFLLVEIIGLGPLFAATSEIHTIKPARFSC